MQGIYWLLTIPHHAFVPYLPPGVAYIRGQLERGENTGYLHWQLSLVLSKKQRIGFIKKLLGPECHAELSRSAASTDYVWKEDTRVDGTPFELGRLPIKRNCQKDWDAVKSDAERGRLDDIPSDILVRYYGNIKRIHQDNLEAIGMEREIVCYWVQQEWANLEEPGKKPGLTLILKIRGVNSGMDIEVKNTLCLMNFEEESTLVMYSDGLTDIRL